MRFTLGRAPVAASRGGEKRCPRNGASGTGSTSEERWGYPPIRAERASSIAIWEAIIMKVLRRQFLQLAAGTAALQVMPRFARAQTYPTRPVRILVGFTAGGAFDIVARLMGQWLSEQLHQPFIVENRPGASTNIATEAVIRAPADGNTLLLGGATNAINATLYEKLNFNFIRDIAP